jgi:hypothetical protein
VLKGESCVTASLVDTGAHHRRGHYSLFGRRRDLLSLCSNGILPCKRCQVEVQNAGLQNWNIWVLPRPDTLIEGSELGNNRLTKVSVPDLADLHCAGVEKRLPIR